MLDQSLRGSGAKSLQGDGFCLCGQIFLPWFHCCILCVAQCPRCTGWNYRQDFVKVAGQWWGKKGIGRRRMERTEWRWIKVGEAINYMVDTFNRGLKSNHLLEGIRKEQLQSTIPILEASCSGRVSVRQWTLHLSVCVCVHICVVRTPRVCLRAQRDLRDVQMAGKFREISLHHFVWWSLLAKKKWLCNLLHFAIWCWFCIRWGITSIFVWGY